MKVEVTKISSDRGKEFAELISIFANVFEIDNLQIPSQKYLNGLLLNENFIALVAKYEGRVIGGLTVHLLSSYYSSDLVAYIYDVGVMPEYQRTGIGKQLISFLSDYCKSNNISEAYVEAEFDDDQAINFYKSTPYHSVLQATHFTYKFS